MHLAGHTAIVYDPAAHSQLMLQGHCNPITCLCVSLDKTVIATADAGAESVVVLWDAASGAPLRTIAAPHDGGVAAMDLSTDGSLLVTMAAAPAGGSDAEDPTLDGFEQGVALWQLDGSHEMPVASANLPPGDLQSCVRFRESCSSTTLLGGEGSGTGGGEAGTDVPAGGASDDFEFVSNGHSRVCFWSAGGGSRLAHTSPAASARDFKQSIGAFTVSAFMPRDPTARAVTGTSDGDVVVWERTGGHDAATGAPRRKAVKVVQLHQSAIMCLVSYGAYLVSGGADGYVRWFDGKFRLEAWFEELAAGGVHSISFAAGGADAGDGVDNEAPLPDFLVGTAEGKVKLVHGDSFEDPTVDEERSGELLLAGVSSGAVYALAASPSADEFAVAGAAVGLEVWDYVKRCSLAQRGFKSGAAAVALTYAADGTSIAAGFRSGHVALYDSRSLDELWALRFGVSPIVELVFRPDGAVLAVADAARTVGALRRGSEPPPGADDGDEPEWEVAGKHRAHTGAITGLAFASCGETEGAAHRLFSVGEDGALAEYDVNGAREDIGLPLARRRQVSRGASPTGLVVLEPRAAAFRGRDDSSGVGSAGASEASGLLLVADSEYKLRSYSMATLECVGTVLAPTYAGPVNRLLPLGEGHLVYGTLERVVGLLQLPLTGDPNAAMGLIAHPGEVAALALNRDGSRLLTAGATDGVINQWRVDTSSFEAAVAEGTGDDARCAALIEGGKEGAFYSEIVDYFYYSQIREQGEATRQERRVEQCVDAEQLPDLMRALGYYPSQADVEDIANELKAKGVIGHEAGGGSTAQIRSEEGAEGSHESGNRGGEADGDGNVTTSSGKVPFQEFLNLYTNYRPVFGVTKEHIETAFAELTSGHGAISTADLLKLLTSMGDMMSPQELESCLVGLMGEDGVRQLPETVDAHAFAETWLGFEA